MSARTPVVGDLDGLVVILPEEDLARLAGVTVSSVEDQLGDRARDEALMIGREHMRSTAGGRDTEARIVGGGLHFVDADASLRHA